jgi:putative addiction module component (TIGR02574 family)
MRLEEMEMDPGFDKIAANAMRLPLRDRVRLAQRLVASLDDEIETGVEALWLAEAERRVEELRSGRVKGIDAAEAFKNAREALE